MASLGHSELKERQNAYHFADTIFKLILLIENCFSLIHIPLKFIPDGPINNNPVLVQMMAWHQTGDKLLSEPMMVQFLDEYMCHLASMSY